LSNTPTASNRKPSLFFSDSDPLDEKTYLFEEPTEEEEVEEPIPTEIMVGNQYDRRDRERIESAFPIRETNGDTKMKNISPFALPHFHGLTIEDPDTFLFEFTVIFQTYDSRNDEKKLNYSHLPSRVQHSTSSWVYLEIA